MKSPMSANATMSEYLVSISSFESPRIPAFIYTFSRPVNSGLNPEPNSSKAATRPLTSISPTVGERVPQISWSNVLFPLPFLPMIPKVEPFGMSNEMSFRAQNSRK